MPLHLWDLGWGVDQETQINQKSIVTYSPVLQTEADSARCCSFYPVTEPPWLCAAEKTPLRFRLTSWRPSRKICSYCMKWTRPVVFGGLLVSGKKNLDLWPDLSQLDWQWLLWQTLETPGVTGRWVLPASSSKPHPGWYVTRKWNTGEKEGMEVGGHEPIPIRRVKCAPYAWALECTLYQLAWRPR